MSAADYDIFEALSSAVNAAKGSLLVAWENVDFTPVVGTAFIRPVILRDDISTVSLGNAGFVLHRGVYLIDILAPLNIGSRSALGTVKTMREAFKGGTVLTHGVATVTIEDTQRLSPIVEKAWMRYPILVRWRCHAVE